MPYPRIDAPALYQWEITSTSNHTRYDYPKAWPAEDQLRMEFILLATVNAVVSFVVFLLIVALLRSKRVYRASPFHRYLLFIAIPDFLVSFFCFITCALSAQQSQFYSEWMCGWQSFYLNFAFIANAWLNGVIVYQIHTMLSFSNRLRRYRPPSEGTIRKHAMAVYLYALLWGLLCAFNNLPFFSSHLYYGFACMPMEYNTASTVVFWVVYIPLTLGLPLSFAVYVVCDIVYRQLLPPTGRRRHLSMFLLRLCSLYFAIWFPFLVLFLVGNFVRISPLIHWIGALLSHLQGLVSALFCCLTNKAIYNAFYLTMTCQPIAREDDYDSEEPAGDGGRSSLSSSELHAANVFIRPSFFFSSLQHRWTSSAATKRSTSQQQLEQRTNSENLEMADNMSEEVAAADDSANHDQSILILSANIMGIEEDIDKNNKNKNDVEVEDSKNNEQEKFQGWCTVQELVQE